ncbi:MAG TPA: cytochrome c [Flavisolibacter sp.]|jgi:mono/diheme cytochrome c family protein|nr:cytochrome c [Flavisolibacter sp.]
MKLKFLFLATATLFTLSLFAAPPVEEGKTIFAARCAACHNVNKVLTGPALAGVDQRRSLEWIVNFVHSSQTVIKKGDKVAVALFNQFNHIQMPDHPDLSADNIKNIVEYIKTEASSAGAEKAPFAKPGKLRPSYQPLSIRNYGFFLSYFALVGLLIGVLIFAVQLKQYQRSVSVKE